MHLSRLIEIIDDALYDTHDVNRYVWVVPDSVVNQFYSMHSGKPWVNFEENIPETILGFPVVVIGKAYVDSISFSPAEEFNFS